MRGSHRGFYPSVWGGDRVSLIPKYFDDGVAVTCEYLAEVFEFAYSVLNIFWLASLAFSNICLQGHTRHKSAIFIRGIFLLLLVGLWQVPRTLPVQKEREDLFKTILAREQRQ